MAAKIRRDDEVVVISGKDRGKTGKVLRRALKDMVIESPDRGLVARA